MKSSNKACKKRYIERKLKAKRKHVKKRVEKHWYEKAFDEFDMFAKSLLNSLSFSFFKISLFVCCIVFDIFIQLESVCIFNNITNVMKMKNSNHSNYLPCCWHRISWTTLFRIKLFFIQQYLNTSSTNFCYYWIDV